jgi:sec-independent protein translocase protein TatA
MFGVETLAPPIAAIIGGLGIGELVLILVIVLIIFGAGKLPQIGDALGKGIRNFRSATRDEDKKETSRPYPELPSRTSSSVDVHEATPVDSEHQR